MEWAKLQNKALSQVLQCSDALVGVYWLLNRTVIAEAAKVSEVMVSTLTPLHGPYCV